YIVDVETTQEKQLLARFKKDPHVMATPDTSYRFVAKAPTNLTVRPIVIGTGPCGMFAGLMLAQMGFRPILLERGKAVRDRTVDTFGFLKKKAEFNPESNAQFGEGAGYAGGILSAGIDGIKVAEAVALSILRSVNHKI
ncbi:hypothetical protein LMJ43_37650, partial [Streptomyces rochei]|nr:hypothetical protein [Streptomyces rochei]